MKSQLVAVVGAVTLFLVFGTFPPWQFELNRSGGHMTKNAGYGPITSPPVDPNWNYGWATKLDTTRLAVEWICLSVVTVGILGAIKLRDTEDRRRKRLKQEAINAVVDELRRIGSEPGKTETSATFAFDVAERLNSLTHVP